MFTRLIASGLLFGMPATAPPAYAANCAMRDTVIGRLSSMYNETLTAGGLQEAQNSSTVIEVKTSQDSGTFTVIVTNPMGISCVVAAGTDWFQSELGSVHPDTAS